MNSILRIIITTWLREFTSSLIGIQIYTRISRWCYLEYDEWVQALVCLFGERGGFLWFLGYVRSRPQLVRAALSTTTTTTTTTSTTTTTTTDIRLSLIHIFWISSLWFQLCRVYLLNSYLPYSGRALSVFHRGLGLGNGRHFNRLS